MGYWLRRLSLVMVISVSSVQGAETADGEDPTALVRQSTDLVIAEVEQRRDELRADIMATRDVIRRLILPHSDVQRMSQWVLGKHWRHATEAQRKSFQHEFTEVLLRTYAAALWQISKVDIVYSPARIDAEGRRASVRTKVPRSGAAPVEVNYSLYRRDDKWRVWNVTIEGISMIASFRSSYGREIAQSGLDALLGKMHAANSAQGGADEAS